MAEDLEIQDKQAYLNVNFTGKFGLDASKRVIDSIIQACSTSDRSAVLLDVRSMTGSLPLLDRYQVVVYGQKMIGKVSKIALVRRQEAAAPDLFTEMVARNRGINLKLFTDIKLAVAWLKA